MTETRYVVSQYTSSDNRLGGAGLGDVNPVSHPTLRGAAEDFLKRHAAAQTIHEENRKIPFGVQRAGVLLPEIYAYEGDGPRRALTKQEGAAFGKEIDSLRINFHPSPGVTTDPVRSGGRWAKAIVGGGAAVAAGMAAAAEPDARAVAVTDALLDTSLPGWVAARKGQACKAFGEAAGSVAGGVAMAVTAPVAGGAAIAATTASGPLAPAVAPLAGIAAAGVVVGAGMAADGAVSSAAERVCNLASQTKQSLTQKLGF